MSVNGAMTLLWNRCLLRGPTCVRRLCKVPMAMAGRYCQRMASTASRARLSKFWIPSAKVAAGHSQGGHERLLSAGFLYQSHSGIFHLLPLGLRVQTKLEHLMDKHMTAVGASKVSLSTITSENLWRMSGRLDQVAPETFRFIDRKSFRFMLSPTHEEEITALVAHLVISYKVLPLRLYQITRKYRDELRPRQGLLRSREFVMKDLYTFDSSPDSALETYRDIQAAYSNVFQELKLPYVVAEASSGEMGGDLSHEFHLLSDAGEDTVVMCETCGYVANNEVADFISLLDSTSQPAIEARIWRGMSRDRKCLICVWYPGAATPEEDVRPSLNIRSVKSAFPDLDSGIEDATQLWRDVLEDSSPVKAVTMVDKRFSQNLLSGRSPESHANLFVLPTDIPSPQLSHTLITEMPDGKPLDFLRVSDGDHCARCNTGRLSTRKALELGHNFYLGQRYSEPLGARVAVPTLQPQYGIDGLPAGRMTNLYMGCHGIGVSRILAAAALHLADERGLNWPRVIAPFEVVVIPGQNQEEDGSLVYDEIAGMQDGCGVDVVLDDRAGSFAWKMKDADVMGFPIIVLVGKRWKESSCVEVQCRRLGSQELVPLKDISSHVEHLLSIL